jgi:hypothetical protein
MTGEAKQVPLTERLLSVPLRARLSIDSDDGKCTSYWPIGLMCYEAAQALQALREEVEGLRRDSERLEWVMHRLSRKELRRIGIETSSGGPYWTRTAIDAAIRNGGEG